MKHESTTRSLRSALMMTLLVVGLASASSRGGAETVRAPSRQWPVTSNTYSISYHYVEVDGHKLFYREAGDPAAQSILLLHGFPTSSHMYRELIPLLAGRYHVVAPAWLLDPVARTLEAFELRDGAWTLIGSLKDEDAVCLTPFAAVSFSLAELWA